MTSSRHHVATHGIQRAMRAALRQAAISKPVTPTQLAALCRTRHRRDFFTAHLLENGYGIRTVHELLGHADVATTMIYTQVLKRGGRGVRSRLDALR
jgi:site-specific recombinase XerD